MFTYRCNYDIWRRMSIFVVAVCHGLAYLIDASASTPAPVLRSESAAVCAPRRFQRCNKTHTSPGSALNYFGCVINYADIRMWALPSPDCLINSVSPTSPRRVYLRLGVGGTDIEGLLMIYPHAATSRHFDVAEMIFPSVLSSPLLIRNSFCKMTF